MMIMYLWCPSSSAGFQNIMVYWLRNPFLIIPCKPFSWWILPFPSRFPCSDYSVCIYSTHIRVQCGILSSTTSCLFLTSSRLLNIIHPYFSSFVIFEHFWEDLLGKVLPSHVDFCFFFSFISWNKLYVPWGRRCILHCFCIGSYIWLSIMYPHRKLCFLRCVIGNLRGSQGSMCSYLLYSTVHHSGITIACALWVLISLKALKEIIYTRTNIGIL
jgi:hypothetical protein